MSLERPYMKDKPVILVVDDKPQNIELLEAQIVPEGYEIVTASNGADALKKVSDHKVDLVLLDVQMPGMDGYEVCRILKLETAKYLPVIMITSLGDRDSRMQGIKFGADDFLSKPLDSAELKLKIRNFLKTKFLYDKVEESYQQLKALDKMKDTLTSFIVHDLRNPLACLIYSLEFLLMSKDLKKEDLDDVEKAKQSAETMKGMISDLLNAAKMENNEMQVVAEDCSLKEIVSSAIKVMTPMNNGKTIHLINKTNELNISVKVQRDLIERVLQNLLLNAMRYTPEQGNVIVESVPYEGSDFVAVSVSDSGRGIPKEQQQKIFDKFSTVESKEARMRGSNGLGLAFCKLAVELHGGKIWVEDRNGGGSDFRFTLPLSGVNKVG
jgi:two-component system sensor histidine kinase/response regulator